MKTTSLILRIATLGLAAWGSVHAADSRAGDPVDALQWLEAPTSERALIWARQTTAESRATLSKLPGYPEILQDLRQTLRTATPVSDVALLGPYAVRLQRDAAHPRGLLQRAERRGETLGAWVTVLDVGALSDREHVDYDLRFSADRCLPPAFDRCLLSFGVGGGDAALLREFNLAQGRFVEGGFTLPSSLHAVAWLDRDTIVVGHDIDGAKITAAKWPAQARLWHRGTALKDSARVFDSGSSDVLFQLHGLGGQGRSLLLQVVDFSTFNLHLIDARGDVQRLPLPSKLKIFGFQGATARHVLVQLTEAAMIGETLVPAESVVSYDLASSNPSPRVEVVYTPRAGEVISSLGFGTTQTRVILPVRSQLQLHLLEARYDATGWQVRPLMSAPAGVDLRVTGADPVGEGVALAREGFLVPPSTELLREDGSVSVIERAAPVFAAASFSVQVRKAQASDGERIDYFLIAPDKPDKRPIPTLITGYGGFGVSLSPAYPGSAESQMYGGITLKLWFEHGGALVVPAIRGGGERGAAWHRAALGEQRQRAFDDLYAVAGDLIHSRITDARHLGVFGTSNGGLLAAVAGLQRPDLFGAVVSDAPLTDMLRYTQMGMGAGWVGEYGDPHDRHAAAWLKRYSPVHLVQATRNYPPFLITVSSMDDRVGPGHARKLAHRLRDAGAQPLFVEAEAGGHSVSDPLLQPELMAMRATFLLNKLGVTAAPEVYMAPARPKVSSDAFVSWARPRAIAVEDFPGNASGADRVGEAIGNARMVALGEPAHGAHEPLEFRNRLARFLIEQRGFTAIALESGFNEARRVNAFVQGGEGDPRQIAREGLTWGFGTLPENVELLRWIRQYNAEPGRSRKVTFHGIDLTGGDSESTFATSRLALDDALSYLQSVAPESSASARAAIEPFLDRFSLSGYQSLSSEERARLRASIESLVASFESQRARWISASSAGDYEWAFRSALVASQLETLFRLSPANVSDGVVPEFYRAAAARDAAMADNALWALRREGASGRVLLFAHNAHVMNGRLRGGLWKVYPEAPVMMGAHLRAALGKALVIVGAGSGHVGAVDGVLSRVASPPFLLDLRGAPPAVTPWLKRPLSLQANYTTEMDVALGEAFDAMIYFDRLQATR
jgi:prolyl oligopeptidase